MKNHRILIGHSDAPELVEEFTAALKAKFGDDIQYEVVMVNPTAGSHCGPNGLGICFHAKHR